MALQLFTPPLRSRSFLLSSGKEGAGGRKKPPSHRPYKTPVCRRLFRIGPLLESTTQGVWERNLPLKSNANFSSALWMRENATSSHFWSSPGQWHGGSVRIWWYDYFLQIHALQLIPSPSEGWTRWLKGVGWVHSETAQHHTLLNALLAHLDCKT